MVKIFDTKNQALKFVKKLSFDRVSYNRIEIRKDKNVWWVIYYE